MDASLPQTPHKKIKNPKIIKNSKFSTLPSYPNGVLPRQSSMDIINGDKRFFNPFFNSFSSFNPHNFYHNPPLLPLPLPNPMKLQSFPPYRKQMASKSSQKGKTPNLKPAPGQLKTRGSEFGIMASPKKSGSNPGCVTKDVKDVLVTPKISDCFSIKEEIMDELSREMVFCQAPPPSSLPLPKFSIRPKLSCNAEAVDGTSIDTGATDNLCRLLRLR